MQVFLLQSVAKLGKPGELVNVRDGYGRNFLIPKKLAVPVTKGTQKQIDEQKKHLTLAVQREEKRALEIKDKLDQLDLSISMQSGKDEKVFGAVTNHAISKLLKEHGVSLDRKKIILEEPIHKLGSYTIPVKLTSKVDANIKLKVVKA
ncbi:MAG: 50S ribosomal protein L9 [Candidatus Omnitrophica bacterium]|nr:50S ribosomal protein L9 [Candidatus Omnitrophota bacterium]